jgi:hypothetical protein
MNLLGLSQWPAMLITVIAAYLVASSQTRRRRAGFWLYLVSNVLWVAWGLYSKAYALVLLQFCLAAMNVRGERRNVETQASQPASEAPRVRRS